MSVLVLCGKSVQVSHLHVLLLILAAEMGLKYSFHTV